MDAKARIRELMAERKWSEYRLAIASGLSQSTVANIFNRNTTPSIATLESICAGFGITLLCFILCEKVLGEVPFDGCYMDFGHYYLKRCRLKGKRCKIKRRDVRGCGEVVEK